MGPQLGWSQMLTDGRTDGRTNGEQAENRITIHAMPEAGATIIRLPCINREALDML